MSLKAPSNLSESKFSHGDCKDGSVDKSISSTEIKNVFPQVITLFEPCIGNNLPTITLEDWSDQSYYDSYGFYLEDKAGTGIHRLAENHPPCLKINGQAYSTDINIFNYPKRSDDALVETELIFIDCLIGEVKIKNITIENVGPYVIRYKWKRIPNYENSHFPIKFPPSREQKFHMDFRPGILMPGEMRNFGVGFRSKHTGVYKEDWEFKTVPSIHSNLIVFKFRALTQEKLLNKPWYVFENRLSRFVSEDFARNIIDHILRKVFEKLDPLQEPPRAELEDEDEVFLYINKDLYTYNELIVKELKELYQITFNERWNLNIFDFQERLLKTKGDISIFKKYKIKLMKSDVNLMPRPYYRIYNAIYVVLGDAITEIQHAVDKARQKYSIKTFITIPQSENPPYYHFPLTKAELLLTATAKEESKQTTRKTAGAKSGPAKTSEKSKGKGKKREYIELIPKQPYIIRKAEWMPDNQSYANDIYSTVYQILCSAIEEVENILNPIPTLIERDRKRSYNDLDQ